MPEPPAWQYKNVARVPPARTDPKKVTLRGRVFTGIAGSTIENGVVEIEDGRIADVVSAAEVSSRSDNREPDADRTILPGFFNNHAHLAWDGANDIAAQSTEDTDEISAYKCAANMLRALRAGITTLRDLGMNKSNFGAKRAVEQGIFDGPKLLICGQAIVQTGGHTFWCCREASGADEMRRAVREQVRGGADLIKIMACHDRLEFTDDELHAVIDETHRNGLKMTAHATYDDAIRRVVEFGVDCVEHGGPMSDETIRLLLDRGTYIVTTLAPVERQATHGIAWGMPEWTVAARKEAAADPAPFDGLSRAARAGVPIVFGTDAGSPVVPHYIVAEELSLMVSKGIAADNESALLSLTSLSARMNGVDGDRGTIEAGKAADVVVVDGNPLADLDAITNVSQVFLDGRRVV